MNTHTPQSKPVLNAILLLLLSALLGLSACDDEDEVPGMVTPQASVYEPTISETPFDENATPSAEPFIDRERPCEVLVVGGSTAALSAALTAARSEKHTCWIEPTDWPGGQLTASGNSAIDMASHKVPGLPLEAMAKSPKNHPTELAEWLASPSLRGGRCWVSSQCYEPLKLLKGFVLPAIKAEERKGFLHLFYNTVPIEVMAQGNRIIKVRAVERKPKKGKDTRRFSKAVIDWYNPKDSQTFDKRIMTFTPYRISWSVIDASENGEVLALSKAPYLVGDEQIEGRQKEGEPCGQSFVFPFVLKPAKDKFEYKGEIPKRSQGFYNLKAYDRAYKWWEIFNYRRIKGLAKEPPFAKENLSLQNWNPGNDFPFGFPLLSPKQTEESLSNWQGGFQLNHLAEAETHALGWAKYLQSKASQNMTLDTVALGTSTGLSKYPYLRESRRSIGLKDFVWKSKDIVLQTGNTLPKKPAFPVGIGLYPIDIHPQKCKFSTISVKEYTVGPFYVPYEALTNHKYHNLVVAGKNLAQSFLVSSATRTQMIEWVTGVAAGVVASQIEESGYSTDLAKQRKEQIQEAIAKVSPIEWTRPEQD